MDSVKRGHARRGNERPPGERGLWIVAGLLAATLVIVVGVPAAAVVAGLVRTIASAGQAAKVSAGLLISTAAHALGIAVLATALAWPAAWMLRRSRRPALAGGLIAVPLLLPHYLAYAALNLLRAPRTPLGDWLAHQPPWASIVFGKTIAVIGLAMWAWPLAVLVLTPAVRALPRETIETLELNGAGRAWPLRRTAHLARMLRGPLVLAVAVITLVMLGSAVPLHVAQVSTAATELWLALNLSPDPAAAWWKAWPLMLVALGAAVVAARWAPAGMGSVPAGAVETTGRRLPGAGTAAVWLLSVGIPVALFATSLHAPGEAPSLHQARLMSESFWRVSGEAVAASARHAAGLGVLTALLALASWAGWSAVAGRSAAASWARRLAAASGAALAAAAIVPGVLVGSAVSQAWGWSAATAWIGDTGAILILAHLARFGVVGCAVGWWLASLEPREVRDARRLDGAAGLIGWWQGVVDARGLGAVAAAGIAAGLLGFHEIEAAVVVQPPGVPSLAQQVLESLHFARDERLAAAAVNLVGLGIVIGAGTGVLLARAAAPRE